MVEISISAQSVGIYDLEKDLLEAKTTKKDKKFNLLECRIRRNEKQQQRRRSGTEKMVKWIQRKEINRFCQSTQLQQPTTRRRRGEKQLMKISRCRALQQQQQQQN